MPRRRTGSAPSAPKVEFPRLDIDLPRTATREHDEQRGRDYRPRISAADACPRRMAYEAVGTPEETQDGLGGIFLDDGHVHEAASARWLVSAGYTLRYAQLGLTVCQVPGAPSSPIVCDTCGTSIRRNDLHGHSDGVIKSQSRQFLWEHKAVNGYRFRGLLNHAEWPEGYITQAACYHRAFADLGVRLDGGILHIKDRNFSKYLQYELNYYPQDDHMRVVSSWDRGVKLYDGLVSKFVDRLASVEVAIGDPSYLPPRPAPNPSVAPCTYCPFVTRCWSTYADEVAEMREGVTLDEGDELVPLLTRLREIRDAGSLLEKEEGDVKKKIEKALNDRKVRKGIFRAEDGRAWWFGLSFTQRTWLDKSLLTEKQVAAATVKKGFPKIDVRPFTGKGAQTMEGDAE